MTPKETFLGSKITAVYRSFSVAHNRVMPLGRLASDAVLDAAYGWLCHRRRDYPADADVWSFRRHWPGEKRRIQADLLADDFRFGLLDRVTLKDGSDIDLWSARDALVLKALTIVPSDFLPLSPRWTRPHIPPPVTGRALPAICMTFSPWLSIASRAASAPRRA